MITASELLAALERPEVHEGNPLLYYTHMAFAYPLYYETQYYSYTVRYWLRAHQSDRLYSESTRKGSSAGYRRDEWKGVGTALKRLFHGGSHINPVYERLEEAVQRIVNEGMTLEGVMELTLLDARTMSCPAVRKRLESGK